MKVHHPESIKEAIFELQEFLESDLYTKFRPEHNLPTGKNRKIEKWYRKDVFPNEKEFLRYIDNHFGILSKAIIRLIGKKKYGSKLLYNSSNKKK